MWVKISPGRERGQKTTLRLRLLLVRRRVRLDLLLRRRRDDDLRSAGLRPIEVEEPAPRLVGPLVGVSAEEVTLRLDQVRGAAALAIGVEIGQRRNRQCLCI